jgi:hypothetical protein
VSDGGDCKNRQTRSRRRSHRRTAGWIALFLHTVPDAGVGGDGRLTGAVNMLVEISSEALSSTVAHRCEQLSRPPIVSQGQLRRIWRSQPFFDQIACLAHHENRGVSPLQWAILRYLFRSRRARDQSQIESYLGVAGSSVVGDLSWLTRHSFLKGTVDPASSSRSSH